MRFEKASCMTDSAVVPEAKEIADTTHFLRRFAGLMANGQNATYLNRTADLLETLAARAATSSDEEQLWRYKYETLSQQNDVLERECEELRHDIERHVKLSGAIIADRDALKITLEAKETELRELGEALTREREALKQERQNLATQSEAHAEALAEQHSAFDQERSALQATADASSRETDQLRSGFERDRDELSAELARSQMELTRLRAAFDREREQLNANLKSRENELAEVRTDFAREREELNGKAEALEAKRVELRSAFERISQLGVEPAAPWQGRDSLGEENSTTVPTETLRQARAQFEFLARECLRRGDIATQAMCELGAHSIDLALVGESPPSSVGEALRILGPILRPGA
jgi:DNA repair exonuclease SbcCD ATPase subunit